MFDGNGNMLSAANTVNSGQNKSFSYNLLNLPITATVPNGTASYTYDNAGSKLRKVDALGGVTTTTDYISGIQYNGTSSSDTLSFIQTEEGKAVHNGTTYDYQYYLADNLGNTRVTFNTKKGIAYTVQQDDYYPFGLEINRSLVIPTKNEYLYNKKELQEEFIEYDYGARFYDPVIGRWNTTDPHGEKYYNWSSYNYVFDDPIKVADQNGMDGEVTGSGTKKDPYVIKANYYYTTSGTGSLSNKQVTALKDGINSYNSLGAKDGGVQIKNADGTSSYVKFDLSVTSVATTEDATTAAKGDSFTDIHGDTRSFGNVVQAGAAGNDDSFGSGDNRTVNFDNTNINNGVTNFGLNENALLSGIVIHEIGHNLGGEHSDGTSVMSLVEDQLQHNDIASMENNSRTISYPKISADFVKKIFDKRDTRSQGTEEFKPGLFTKQK